MEVYGVYKNYVFELMNNGCFKVNLPEEGKNNFKTFSTKADMGKAIDEHSNYKCKFCIPYKEKIIEGKNGFFCITKEHEIVAFSNHNSNTESQRININFCPMCGRKLTENA